MGWQRVPAGSFTKQQVTIPTITVKEAGFIFVYLSYEDLSNNYVYFDDFKVTVTPTNIIQANEYYTFGAQTANSWSRVGTLNNFLANGGTELNTTSNPCDLEYRSYDPLLGKMHQVDPAAHQYSSLTPYNFAFNMPNMVVDVNGADPNQSGMMAEEESAQRRARQRLGWAVSYDAIYGDDFGFRDMSNYNLWDAMWGTNGWGMVGGIADGFAELHDWMYGNMTVSQ